MQGTCGNLENALRSSLCPVRLHGAQTKALKLQQVGRHPSAAPGLHPGVGRNSVPRITQDRKPLKGSDHTITKPWSQPFRKAFVRLSLSVPCVSFLRSPHHHGQLSCSSTAAFSSHTLPAHLFPSMPRYGAVQSSLVPLEQDPIHFPRWLCTFRSLTA